MLIHVYWELTRHREQEKEKKKKQSCKYIQDFNNMISKFELMDTYRISCSRFVEYTFIPSKHGTFKELPIS